jgi:hypothetical protein
MDRVRDPEPVTVTEVVKKELYKDAVAKKIDNADH